MPDKNIAQRTFGLRLDVGISLPKIVAGDGPEKEEPGTPAVEPDTDAPGRTQPTPTVVPNPHQEPDSDPCGDPEEGPCHF